MHALQLTCMHTHSAPLQAKTILQHLSEAWRCWKANIPWKVRGTMRATCQLQRLDGTIRRALFLDKEMMELQRE